MRTVMTMAQGDLPTGTVTLLFTDIEGSTRLASQLGLTFSAQLGEHDRILREAISANDGTVSSTAGDSFFATFSDAASAVVAAVAAQRGLHAFAWAGDPIRARMGLHTADRTADDEGYPEIARAARIMAAAHGGQVLMSDASHALVADKLPEGVRVRPLTSSASKGLVAGPTGLGPAFQVRDDRAADDPHPDCWPRGVGAGCSSDGVARGPGEHSTNARGAKTSQRPDQTRAV